MVGITSFGGYIPRLRLQRSAIAEAHLWSDPGVAGKGKGERSICNWDEDAVTMGVEAARDCLNASDKTSQAVYFASTTMPFRDRQNAGIVSTALSMGEDVAVLDVTASQRAATSALLQALAAVKSDQLDSILVVASDHRRSKSASPQEFNFGDGAAAVQVGTEGTLLEYLGGHSRTVDFVDHFRGANQEFDYQWEERWIRDEGYQNIVPPTIHKALEKVGITADAINHFVMPATIGRAVQGIARTVGIDESVLRSNLHLECGETGAAHPLVMLLHLLETDASAGDIVMLVGFGQGCDALLFRVTEALAAFRVGSGITGSLAKRREETNYQKFLTFNDLVTLEKGMRAEKDSKTALTVLYRKRDMLLGLIGGRCTQCGTAQFPRQDICVNPQCHASHSQEPYSFVEESGKIQSWSADYLTYTMSPPSHYGMIVFDNGGRFMSDITDVVPGEIDVGTRIKMVFRIKEFDRNRGFVRYFWKGVPV
jgi:3-hydroxy-3-methylglutaryl CoA synthase